MIFGIGTDLCAISDIKRRLSVRGPTFLEQFCVRKEIHQVLKSKHPEQTASRILTSKEAFSKALGTGYTTEFWWDDIEISWTCDQPAQVSLNLQAAEIVRAGLVGPPSDRIHLSWTIRGDICLAFVVIERI